MVELPTNDLLVLLLNMTGVYRVTTDTMLPVPGLDRQILSLWVQGEKLYLLENRSGDYYALTADLQTLEVESEIPVSPGNHILVNEDGVLYVIKQSGSAFGSSASLRRIENGVEEGFSVPGGDNTFLFAGHYIRSYLFDAAGQPVLGTSENSVYTFVSAQDSFAYVNGPVHNADITAFAIDATERFWFLIGPTIFIRDAFWDNHPIDYEGSQVHTDAIALQLRPGRIWTINEAMITRRANISQSPVIWEEPFANSQTPDALIREALITGQDRIWVSTEEGIFYTDKCK